MGAITSPLHVWGTQAQATGTHSVRLSTNVTESQVSGSGTLSVDWGDGKQSTLDYTDAANRWEQTSFPHSYDQPGVYTVTVTAAEGGQSASQQVSLTTQGSEFFPVTPSRVLDTRTGIGTGAAAHVASGQTVTIDPATFPGRPAGPLSAVVLNLTAVTPSGNGYVTAWSDISGSRPTSSSLNYITGQTRANSVTVPVGPDGKIHLYNQGGAVDLLADLQGYYAAQAGQGYHPLVPLRLMDTRTNLNGRSPAKVPARGSTTLTVEGTPQVPAQGVTAVALNLTETGSTAPGFVTAFPDGTALPTASNLNFAAKQDVPNLVIVPIGSDGKVQLFNGSSQPIDLVADIEGYYTSTPGLDFVPAQLAPGGLTPNATPIAATRILDTRTGLSWDNYVPKGRIGAYKPLYTLVPAFVNESAPAQALVLNLTTVNPDTTGWLWIDYLDESGAQATSGANYVPHQAVSNGFMAITEGSPSRGIELSFANISSGSTDLLADVAGYFA
jgi:hypothetical protein